MGNTRASFGDALNAMPSASRSSRMPPALLLLVAEMDRMIAWRLGATLALVVAVGLLSGLGPLALKGLVDAVATTSGTLHAPMPTAALTFALLYLLALCGSRLIAELRPLVASGAEQRLFRRLRQRFFAHALRLPLAFHLERRTGALLQTLQQGMTGYQLLVVHLIDSIVPVLVEVLTVTWVLIHLDQGVLTSIFTATALAYVTVFALGTSGLRRHAKEVSDASLDTQAILADGLLNCETLKCFNAESATCDRLSKKADDLEGRWLRLYRLRARMGLAQTAVFTLSTVAALSSAAGAVANGTLSVGGFVLANVYMLQVVRPLEMLGVAIRDVSHAIAFIRPLLDVLARPSEAAPDGSLAAAGKSASPPPHADATPTAATSTSPSRGPSIRFRNVRFGYAPGRDVVRALDLDIAAGASVALIGASGSGKSSLARLLMRLCEPSDGCIELDATPIDELCTSELRDIIALVPQDVALLNDSIAANICLGRKDARRADIERAARIAHLHEFICQLPAGYDTLVGERGMKLSGGERQRMAIARAVFRRPRVYILDEATSMLDGTTETAVLRELRAAAAGCTTIMIAHRLWTARVADEIVVLENGRIAERGNHAALVASDGAYARLWRAQQRGGVV